MTLFLISVHRRVLMSLLVIIASLIPQKCLLEGSPFVSMCSVVPALCTTPELKSLDRAPDKGNPEEILFMNSGFNTTWKWGNR